MANDEVVAFMTAKTRKELDELLDDAVIVTDVLRDSEVVIVGKQELADWLRDDNDERSRIPVVTFEQKRGKWEDCKNVGWLCRCSECREVSNYEYPYCPNCGALMREELEK